MQPDTITPGGPQGLNRYSYVGNSPILYDDPTGHSRACDPMEGDCQHDPVTPAPSPGGNGGGGGDDALASLKDAGSRGGGNQCSANDPNCVLSDNQVSDPSGLNGILCTGQVLSTSTCKQINGLVGVTVLVLDGVSFVGSGIFAALTIVALLGGPIGLGAVTAAYQIANLAEGWAGAASFVLTLANDIFIAGGTHVTLGSNPELVVSSDVVASFIFAASGGIDPEPFGDTLINGAATIYDAYRLTGGDLLFSLHISPSGWYLTE